MLSRGSGILPLRGSTSQQARMSSADMAVTNETFITKPIQWDDLAVYRRY